MSTAVKAWLSLILVLLFVYGSYTAWRFYRAARYGPNAVRLQPGDDDNGRSETPTVAQEPARRLDEFSFVERSGRPFKLDSLKGDIWVASFFFASCPGFCRQMNGEVAKLANEFKESGVKFVSLTVDPDNDTPAQLRSYAESLHADPEQWLFLTGDFGDVRALGQDVFKVSVSSKSGHTDRLVLVDRSGRIRGRYRGLDASQVRALKRQIRELLDEQSSKEAT